MLAILSTVAISCKDKEGDDSADSGYVNGHEYVDLGLSVKWVKSIGFQKRGHNNG